MAVTIIQQPDAVALTEGGRMVYQFHGNGRIINTGVRAINSILILGAIEDGDVFELAWKGQTLKMIARDNPLESHEFPAGDGSPAYITDILPYFRDYYPIQADFTVEAVTPEVGFRGLKITALLPGTEYNFAGTGGGAMLYAVLNGTPGVSPQIRDRYSVYVELWLQRPGQLISQAKRVYATVLETDESGDCTFDVGGTLHGLLSEDLPTWTSQNGISATQSWGHYFLRYTEAWGEPSRKGRMTASDLRRAYLGGMPYEQFGRFRLADYLNPGADDAGRDRFLRFGPTTRYIRPDEPQFLTFLNLREDRAGLKLNYEVTLDNGQQLFYQNRHEPVDCPLYGKVTWPVGILQANLLADVPAGRTISEYTVRGISDTTGMLTETIRFVIDYRYQQHLRYFAYVSSLGAVDTFYTYGKGSRELALFKEQAERVLPVAYELSDGQFVEYDTALQDQVTVATGWRNKADLRLLNDFYRSNRRFELRPDRALPIGLLSKSIKQFKDGDTTFAHSFEFVYLFKDEFFHYEEEGEPLPPAGFTPAGTLTVQPVQVVNSRDNTIPNVVRDINQQAVNNWTEAASWGDHRDQGYLTQQTGANVFAPNNHTHPWSAITGKPDFAGVFEEQDIDIAMTDHPVNGEMEIAITIDAQTFVLPDPILNRFLRLL